MNELVKPKHSTPGFGEFDPRWIPYQADVLDLIKFDLDYSLGVHHILLSGSVGSAKSILMAHIIVRHCLEFRNARFLIGRKALPDLKDTLYLKIKEHLQNDAVMKKGVHWQPTDNIAKIEFANGSEIISRSWHDQNFEKFRSLELSGAAIEELTENKGKYKRAIDEIRLRVGRLPHVPENLMLYATNPDGPSMWVYNDFELHLDDKQQQPRNDLRLPTKHVFYSRTADNPFLPKSYIENMKDTLDEKMFERMALGRWIEIASETVYYAYDKSRNFVNEQYIVDPFYPVHICWDFNIGKGKPLSLCLFQHKGGTFHVFAEVILDGADTEESCIELGSRGLLDYDTTYIVNGDATGEAKSTKSKRSDYDIIKKYLANYRTRDGSALDFQMKVPKSNPPIKTRHNLVNGYCYNANKAVRLLVYKDCKTVDEALRLTALKDGGQYIEDDGPNCPYQHVGTALGYGICWVHKQQTKTRSDQVTTRFR
jgi:PBSX family phage terminase large subunit